MASKQLILTNLTTMAVVYNRQFTGEEFKLVLDVWHDLFANINDDIFSKHCNYYMKESKRFPTPADLLNTCEYEQNQRGFVLETTQKKVITQ